MATQKQTEANQRNAQKSTGPKTEAGKAASSANRLSHGFLSSTIVIPGEDPAEFRGLLLDFMAEHQPATVTEQVLVEKMAHQQWLSLRAFRLQGETFIAQMLRNEASAVPKDLALLIRYQTTADRAFHRALADLLKLKKQRLNSEIGFEPQTFGEELPQEPELRPQPVPITPISPDSPRPTFATGEKAFALCPEALEFFKKAS